MIEKKKKKNKEQDRRTIIEMQEMLYVLLSNSSTSTKKYELRRLNASNSFTMYLKNTFLKVVSNKEKQEQKKLENTKNIGILNIPLISIFSKNMAKFFADPKKDPINNTKTITRNSNINVLNQQKEKEIPYLSEPKKLEIKKIGKNEKINCLKVISSEIPELKNYNPNTKENMVLNSSKISKNSKQVFGKKSFVEQLLEQKENSKVNSNDIGRTMERPEEMQRQQS